MPLGLLVKRLSVSSSCSLGFLTTWRLGSKHNSPRGVCREEAIFTFLDLISEVMLRRFCCINSPTLLQRPAPFQGEGNFSACLVQQTWKIQFAVIRDEADESQKRKDFV